MIGGDGLRKLIFSGCLHPESANQSSSIVPVWAVTGFQDFELFIQCFNLKYNLLDEETRRRVFGIYIYNLRKIQKRLTHCNPRYITFK